MPRRALPAALLACTLACAVGAALSIPPASRAESWCAYPLVAHEWGVQVFAQGHAQRLTADARALPGYFHDAPAATPPASGPPVRGLPVDGGERELPVLQFYTAGGFLPVPLGLEVGFAQGDASAWYPQVDTRRTAADANGAAAHAARTRLLGQRTARGGAARTAPAAALLPEDPTRQLAWDALSLTEAPTHARAASQTPWVTRLRGAAGALWVNGASESERFVFYEARTTETPALRVERGPTYAPGRRHLLIRNVSHAAVFDVFLVHREGAQTFLFYAPSIPAGAFAGLVLEDHAANAAAFAAGTRARLRTQLVDAQQPSPPRTYAWGTHDCVMMRDPAIPVEAAEGHRLYANEVDALLEVWGARFFDAPATTLVYREDVHTLDAVMPLSVYTDMYHFVQLRRAGLAVLEDVALP